MVGRPANGFAAGVVEFGGGGGRRMGAQPSVFMVNTPQNALRFTTVLLGHDRFLELRASACYGERMNRHRFVLNPNHEFEAIG
jgi:hypothetical protein